MHELRLMAKAADLAAWCRTFAVLAQLFNANRDPEKSEAIDPMKFYMWSEKQESAGGPPPPTEAERAQLREIFPKRK